MHILFSKSWNHNGRSRGIIHNNMISLLELIKEYLQQRGLDVKHGSSDAVLVIGKKVLFIATDYNPNDVSFGSFIESSLIFFVRDDFYIAKCRTALDDRSISAYDPQCFDKVYDLIQKTLRDKI